MSILNVNCYFSMMCYLYFNVIGIFNFNIRLCCNGQFYKVNVNLKYPLDFIRIEGIDLNQIFYDDIVKVSDEERDMEYTVFENDYEMQEDIRVSNIVLDPFQFLSSTWYMFLHKAYIYMI